MGKNQLIFENEYLDNKRIGVLPFRCHHIPFAPNDNPRYVHGILDKWSSSRVTSLNGDWQFKAYPRFQDFYSLEERLDATIPVPSCVQCHGYDVIQYLNVVYPFPFNPPHIDIDDPLFRYRRVVSLKKKERHIIVFEGVDNAFYLLINGKKVGYSNIAHSKSEFDITDYLVDGDNTIDVLVLKWSASSYFEDQDKFRFSGIFRDVYLLSRPKKYIEDYRITTATQGKDGLIEFENRSDVDLNLRFLRKVYPVKARQKTLIRIPNAKLWSDKDPHLYSLVITSGEEVIYEKIGIRQVTADEGVFKINGIHQKLFGVNRHESNPLTGSTVTIEDTYKDLLLMKRLGVNAVRTSHYPDIPEFYELCDRMGIYVLDEADLETHGAGVDVDHFDNNHWRIFADDTRFEEAIYQREVSLFERDKNRTCVVIFSLGNESCYGASFQKGFNYLHAVSDRPIHYEGVWNSTIEDDYYDPRFSFASRMYPSPEELKEKHLDNPRENRPIILCEYSHAMGNSNGDLRDYWALIHSSDRFAGGFVWEWCDHAVMVDGKLHYGGDSNDLYNDGNFCVDGLVTPFRKIKSNTRELMAVYHGKLVPDEPIDKTKGFLAPASIGDIVLVPDEANAGLKEVLHDGRPLLDGGIVPQFMRARLDNDEHEVHDGFVKLNRAKMEVLSSKINPKEICFEAQLFDEVPLLRFKASYKVKDGSLNLSLDYEVLDDNLLVPRAGFSFKMRGKAKTYRFFGYGPDESYIDKCVHNRMGEFTRRIGEELASNLKPQECGSHYFTSYVYLKNLAITADKPFSFSVLPCSTKTLGETKHNYELPDSGEAYVNLDVAMAGVGTGSCGPRLDRKYWIPQNGRNAFHLFFKK